MTTAAQENRIAQTTEPATTDQKPQRTVPTLEFLPVPYTDAEILTRAEEMARYETERQTLEEQFEAIKLDFKSKLEALAGNIKKRSREIRVRSHYENVECVYVLERPSPHEKTLIRLDTGEIVRRIPMDARDYQDPLPAVLKSEDPIDRTEVFSLAPPANKEKTNGNGANGAADPIH